MSERPTSFYLDAESRETLERVSRERGMSRSAILREAIKTLEADAQMKEVRRLVSDLHKAVNGR